MTDFVEMFRHWHARRSQVQIYDALGIDPPSPQQSPNMRSYATAAPEELPDRWHLIGSGSRRASGSAVVVMVDRSPRTASRTPMSRRLRGRPLRQPM